MLEDLIFQELSTVIYTFTLVFTKYCEVRLFFETNKEIAKMIYEDGTLRNITSIVVQTYCQPNGEQLFKISGTVPIENLVQFQNQHLLSLGNKFLNLAVFQC